MNTKYLMMASAFIMGIAGIACTFMPDEILNFYGISSTALNAIFLQLLGALYLGFAILNWMAKSNIIGGIYSKPVALGNFAHFFIAGITLIKGAFSSQSMISLWIASAIYAIFAISFSMVAFGNPLNNEGTSS